MLLMKDGSKGDHREKRSESDHRLVLRSRPARFACFLLFLRTPRPLLSRVLPFTHFTVLLFTFGFATDTDDGVKFPGPWNVAEGGAPNTPGCGDGAARHASAVTHAGGAAPGAVMHGDSAVHSCAS